MDIFFHLIGPLLTRICVTTSRLLLMYSHTQTVLILSHSYRVLSIFFLSKAGQTKSDGVLKLWWLNLYFILLLYVAVAAYCFGEEKIRTKTKIKQCVQCQELKLWAYSCAQTDEHLSSKQAYVEFFSAALTSYKVK